MASNVFFPDWVTGDVITASKMNQMKNGHIATASGGFNLSRGQLTSRTLNDNLSTYQWVSIYVNREGRLDNYTVPLTLIADTAPNNEILYLFAGTSDNRSSRLYTVNTATGAATLVSGFGFGGREVRDVAIAGGNGMLVWTGYYESSSAHESWAGYRRIVFNADNTYNSSATIVSGSSSLNSLHTIGMGYNPGNDFWYVLNSAGDKIHRFQINAALNGTVNGISATAKTSNSSSTSIDLAWHNNVLYMANGGTLYTVDPVVGGRVTVGAFGGPSIGGLTSLGGTLYGVGGNKLYTISTTGSTNLATEIGSLGITHGRALDLATLNRGGIPTRYFPLNNAADDNARLYVGKPAGTTNQLDLLYRGPTDTLQVLEIVAIR